MEHARHLIEIAGSLRHRHGWRPSYPGTRPSQPSHPGLLGTPGTPTTPGLDLRALAPDALDQGQAASCTAHAARSGLHVMRILRHVPLHDDSRKMLYWCGREVEGMSTVEDSGCTIAGIVSAAQLAGACDEATDPYPFDPTLLSVPPRPDQYEAAAPFRLKMAALCANVGEARRALFEGHPVLCGVQLFAGSQGQETNDTGKVPMPVGDEDTIGGHAICLLHDDLTLGEVWALNSWGPTFGATAPDGRRGWLRLSYEYLARYGDEYTALVA